MTPTGLFDPGLQPERTDLAWRRTVLALVVGALISLRLLPPVLGSWSLAVGLVGLLLTGVTWILARRRSQLIQAALLTAPEPLPGAAPLLLLVLETAGASTFGLAYVAFS